LPPVDFCNGVSPSQAAKWRPARNPSAAGTSAVIAVEAIGLRSMPERVGPWRRSAPVMHRNLEKNEPEPGIHRTLVEGLESALGLMALHLADNDNVAWSYTTDGRRYRRYASAFESGAAGPRSRWGRH